MDLKHDYPHIHISLIIPGIVDSPFQDIAGTPLMTRAGTKFGRFTIQSPDEVASYIVGLIDHPIAELYTSASLAELARKYYEDVGSFEKNNDDIFRL
jgi:short-subunit dehydrogenase